MLDISPVTERTQLVRERAEGDVHPFAVLGRDTADGVHVNRVRGNIHNQDGRR